ncbi:MAG: OmpA family protein [Acidiferrobacterales bacterium]|nr:OmpA family protein [Acidiferrobacterales bacterium]
MKKCSLFCAWWPFILFPLLLLILFSLFQWRSVEQDVVGNAQQTINQAEQAWAEADTFNRGREVLVTGFAPSQQDQDDLRGQILSAEGVRSVTFLDGIAEPVPLRDPSLTLNWLDNNVILNGELNSQAAIDSLVNDAQSIYGAERVINQLQLSDAIADIVPMQGLFESLNALNNGAEVSISNDRIVLTGEVETNAIKSNAGAQVARMFSGTVDNALTVKPAPIPEPIVVNMQCEERLDELLSTSKVEFDTGRSTISPASNDLLTRIAEVSRDCPDDEFEVSGHTDSTGGLDANMKLSLARAQAVIDRLAELGINTSRFSAQGYGPNQPIADNSTVEGRAQNRRIEFNLKN